METAKLTLPEAEKIFGVKANTIWSRLRRDGIQALPEAEWRPGRRGQLIKTYAYAAIERVLAEPIRRKRPSPVHKTASLGRDVNAALKELQDRADYLSEGLKGTRLVFTVSGDGVELGWLEE